MAANAKVLTLLRDLYGKICALLKCAVRTSSPHRSQEFAKNVFKAVVIQLLTQYSQVLDSQ